MILRPVDAAGDILPVLSSRALLSGPEAVARLVEYRLSLLAGEWWENTGFGFSILQAMNTSRLTEDSGSALASMITSYIRETSGVQEVEDVHFSIAGREFSYSCDVLTKEGKANVVFSTVY
ncbi:MAG: hypothetical protein IJQ71_11010 [Clostridia bacterium]|nr:hypothetical protein [Clostridia bacterium]